MSDKKPTTLYDKMKDQPYNVNLDALWKELGIERNGKWRYASDEVQQR